MNNYLIKKAQKIFVDSLRIKVQGGSGGHGLPQYGGIGGKGGDVYIVASRSPIVKLDSILRKPYCKQGWFRAGDGHSAIRTKLMGKPGQDLLIEVPIGVEITDSDNQHVGEINGTKDKVIIAVGGRGGDKFNDNHGFQGQKRTVKLDLKMISDAVFVGFPNAGKSSLLRAVSMAKPKVANYPFTTLRPHLGVVQYQDHRRITMADLPGLVEGAHRNIGLGHEFLKHIVRSRLLIFVIDINEADLGPSYARRSPIETLCILNKEIELYDDTLLNKPAILALSKVDSEKGDAMRDYEKFREDLTELHESSASAVDEVIRPTKLIKFDEVLPISPLKGLGINKLKDVARDVIDKYEEISKENKDRVKSFRELQDSENNRLIIDNC